MVPIRQITITILFLKTYLKKNAKNNWKKIYKDAFSPYSGGGQRRLRASSSLNFDKNNHRMRL